MKYIEIEAVNFRARVGSPIHECICEAAVYAFGEQVPVVLVHNGTSYHIAGGSYNLIDRQPNEKKVLMG